MPAKRLSHRLRQRDAVRQRPRPAARHLRQGRQQRRVSIATLDDLKVLYGGFDLHRAQHQRQHDDQRPGADDPGDVHEHRDRPEPRQVPRRQRPRAHRRRGRTRSAPGCWRTCAAPCRPTS
ncbi:MAG: hypothetical protein MZW92_36735 [Comamonadaceae bacterium]|nr:hypothetical protein [Comamonadaceae bacterium]